MNFGTSILVPTLAAIISGIVILALQEAVIRRKNKKQRVELNASEQDKDRTEQMSLVIRYLNAIGKLTYANSVAIRDHRTNGELKDAMKEYNEMDTEMYDYLVTHGMK